jgi:hypothetical protein
MTDLLSDDVPQGLPGGETLGVMDALGMGWRLMMADFWPIWLIGLVAFAIQMGAGILGAIPYLGACVQLALAIFVQPALTAGVFYAIRQCIDGSPAQVGDVFEGFRQRYWQSVVAVLLPLAVGFVGAMLLAGIIVGAVAIGEESGGDEALAVVMLCSLLIVIPLLIGMFLVGLLFMFSLVAVWDHPESGWEAVKDSARVVRGHFLSCIGFGLLFGLIAAAAYLAGAIACCVGIFFTMPFVTVWLSASMIYLYRCWTGQPLVQPIAVEVPAEGAGPVAPTDVLPPGV